MKINLSRLTYCPGVTRLKERKVSQIDFIILLLGSSGQVPLHRIYDALSSFRGEPINRHGHITKCNFLFDRVYGYVSYAHDPSVQWPEFFIAARTGPSFWYRVSRGVYSLNAAGEARYAKLVS